MTTIKEALANSTALDFNGEDGQLYLTQVLTHEQLDEAIQNAIDKKDRNLELYLKQTKGFKTVVEEFKPKKQK